MKKTQGRIIMRIEISQQALDSFTKATEERGMKQIAATSRVIEWFVSQDAETQATILGLMPSGFEVDAVRRSLEQMAGQRE